MDAVAGAMAKLPSKLLELLKEEYKLQAGVKDQIWSVSQELESTHAALRKVATVPWDQLDEQVKVWAREVREASYDMEDILDTFLVRVEGHEPADPSRLKRAMKKMGDLFNKGKARREIAGAIQDINKRLQKVAQRRARYRIDDHLAPRPDARTKIDPRLSALYTKASLLVGTDEPRDRLIEMLSIGDGDLLETKVVSVVGLGGLGKTTLAKAVYDNLTNNYQFKAFAFVPVGQNPVLKKVLMDILIGLDNRRYTREINLTILDERQLIDELREFLKHKRYFIVIDDIWDVPSWNTIRLALDDNNLGSKIVITTRNHDVAEKVGCSYKMKPLPYESSKMLFYGRIFVSEEQCPSQLLEVSEKILRKCGGVPLAIITISSLLANKSSKIEEWCEVCDSIGSGVGTNTDMRKILSLSYYDLPSHLKTCLLYISIFPEDYNIGRDRLIRMWIAEDFIQHGGGSQSLFELGKSYFNELVNRSLIQVADMDDDGRPPTCHVHDMVLDLICCISRGEGFVTTVLNDDTQRTSLSGSKVRRLSLHNTTWPTMDMVKMRSLIIFNPAIINSMPSRLSCYHLLRVLDLQALDLKDRPSLRFVGELLHLRYLALGGAATTTYATELPVEIGKLQHLQTLMLNGIEMKELPSSIVGLRQLMCLTVGVWRGQGPRVPNGLKSLTSLEVLGTVIVDSACTAEELGHLTHLRILTIELRKDMKGRWDESLCTALVVSLSKLHKIQNLTVLTSDGVEVDLEGSVESLGNLHRLYIDMTCRLPTWINPVSLVHLYNLDIGVGQVRWEDIHVLGMLPALRVLLLRVSRSDDRSVALGMFMVSPDAFPCATYCMFSYISMVPSMFPPGAMPRLEHFTFCIQLEDFSSGEFAVDDLALGHLPSLKSVHVIVEGQQNVSEEVGVKVKEALRQQADAHPNHPGLRIYPE